MVRRLSGVFVLLAVGLLGYGCASGGGAGGETGADSPQEGIVIQVDNNVPGGGDMMLFIEPEAGGIRQPLGQIGPAETRNFAFSGNVGTYRIAYQGARTGQTAVFRILANSCIRWRTDQSTPQVLRGGCN